MLALINALKALPTNTKDCRIDVDVDNRVLIYLFYLFLFATQANYNTMEK